MNKTICAVGALYGMLAVILGAYGAHALKTVLTPEAITTFETGVKYQMYHALLLLFLGVNKTTIKHIKLIFVCVALGVLLFSGSIYLLATNSLTSFNANSIALVTPIGGTLLIFGWFLLFYGFIVKTNN